MRNQFINTFETNFRKIINNNKTQVTSIHLYDEFKTEYILEENKNYKPVGSPFYNGRYCCQAFIKE